MLGAVAVMARVAPYRGGLKVTPVTFVYAGRARAYQWVGDGGVLSYDGGVLSYACDIKGLCRSASLLSVRHGGRRQYSRVGVQPK